MHQDATEKEATFKKQSKNETDKQVMTKMIQSMQGKNLEPTIVHFKLCSQIAI